MDENKISNRLLESVNGNGAKAMGLLKVLAIVVPTVVIWTIAVMIYLGSMSATSAAEAAKNAADIMCNKIEIKNLSKQLDRMEVNQQSLLHERGLKAAKK